MTDTPAAPALDPVALALLQNRLDHIARHMGWVMTRTARSPIFNQSHDFSCFITDRNGQLLSQADGIPIHTGGGGFSVRALIAAFDGRFRPGDAYLSNDPYVAGGNHLPDWVIARPVFVDGTLVAFACNRAHQSDIGGGAAGTYNPTATEIFHEGIRLPPLRLVEEGVMRDDLWALLMANTRTPQLLDGDLGAMLGSTEIGAQKIAETITGLPRDEATAYLDGMLDYGERRFTEAIAALGDGVFEAEERFDNDCFGPADIRIRVRISLEGGRARVDFTGTSPQIRGFKNSSLANTHSGVYAAFGSFLDADLPRNEGSFRAIEVIAPEGSLLNPRAPAPVTMCTVFPAYEIIHACWWALGQAAPERACAGWGKNSFPNSSGTRDGKTWVMYHWGGLSGGGAVAGRDGFAQIGPLVTLGGLTLPNAEVYEQLYPVRVLRQELVCDGGGAGAFRGGTGVHYECDVLTAAEYSFRAEGTSRPTGLGVEGGSDGARGRVALREGAEGEARPMPDYALSRFGPARLSMTSPGGGGYGDPFDRAPEAVCRDVRDGLVSPAAARAVYGVAVADDGRSHDGAETARLRTSPG
ncbi:hydantoinase B/oxoprolinase family protein [Paralimibaculum aggregatum]|uniref:Hydantoinase B/oxoprolinase family protein n=1 Tax=Paralimibaculum aggregatum TaxID=3036245 RepID=A0ABQ6LFK4_9RHOB|nr:hydantoinase B/oxoprolinase family protein [Limibaculum sp. NKW23]GMG82114.1 hydantoinase B/oxoprolinase family protein [Limibaculum sp. NKW23]